MKQEYRQLSVPITFAGGANSGLLKRLERAREINEAFMAESLGWATSHQLEMLADWRERLNPRWMNGGEE